MRSQRINDNRECLLPGGEIAAMPRCCTGVHVTSRCHCGNFRNDLPHNRATFVIWADARVISFATRRGGRSERTWNATRVGEEEREWGKGGTTDRIDGLYSRFEIFAGRRRGGAAGVSSETSAKMDIGVPFIIARHGNLPGGAPPRVSSRVAVSA